MVKSLAKADVAIFEGPDTVSLVFLRINKKSGLLEYRYGGFHFAWHRINVIPEELIGPEKYLEEEGVKTRRRIVKINCGIDGKPSGNPINPRMLEEFETLKTRVIYKTRLAKFYYERLVDMMGKDRFEEMMKKTFKTVADTKTAGNIYEGGQGYDQFRRGFGYRPPMTPPRPSP